MILWYILYHYSTCRIGYDTLVHGTCTFYIIILHVGLDMTLLYILYYYPTYRIGYDTLVYIEGLHLSGSMQAIIHIDYEAPFPHIACISATFVRK